MAAGAKRRSRVAWSPVSAVPSGATTCSTPASTSRSTSKYPSTRMTRLLLPDRALGLMQVVELLPLVKDRGLGRVEILGLARAEQAPAEPHHASAQVVNREEQAAAEPGDHRAVVPLGARARPRAGPAPRCPSSRHRREERLAPWARSRARSIAGGLERDRRGPARYSRASLASAASSSCRVNQSCAAATAPEERLPRIGARAAGALGNDDAGPPGHLADGGGIVHPEPLHEPARTRRRSRGRRSSSTGPSWE